MFERGLINRKHRGAFCENVATNWLLQKGYDVFKNTSPHGLIDIIAVDTNTGEHIFIDVKATRSTRDQRQPQGAQKKLGVEFLFVDELGNCYFDRDSHPIAGTVQLA